MNLQLPIEPRVPPMRSTGMRTLHQCRRKFYWSELYGLKRGEDSSALRIGTYVHLMLAAQYRGRTSQEAFEEAVEDQTFEQEALLTRTKTSILASGERFESISKQMTEDLQKAYAMQDAFLAYYPLTPEQEVLATEVFFEVKVPGLEAPLQGQIDLILRHRKTKKLTLVDIKTHGQTTQSRVATNVFDVQTHLFYTMGLQSMLAATNDPPRWEPFAELTSPPPSELRGIPVEDFTSVEYFLLKKPTIKCCKKDDYDLGNYIQRVRKWYDEQTEKDPNNPPFAASIQPILGNPLDRPEAIRQLEEYDKACQMNPTHIHWFFRTADSSQCSGNFGDCPYLALCRTDQTRGQWPVLIKETFRQEFRQ